MKKILKYMVLSVLTILVGIAVWLTVLYLGADMGQPEMTADVESYEVAEHAGWRECRGNYLRQSESGLWEAYLHGAPFEMGVASGRLSRELLEYQEEVFVDQINRIVPSESYLKFLRFFLVVFNRNLGEYVPEEYRQEIYGISLSCSDRYNAIGTPYERQINYHAAHDIGHTMQNYMLVGCSSFGAWGGASADSTLIIGRNFDFYVGDEFAKNKLVLFVSPEKGHRFASVGWAGMIGVLSGMNEKGLTVTLNAAKGSFPTSAAMPISILAREILQYAATIDEAYAIAQSRTTFVSESLLIGSAADGRAAIIEKTPARTALFESDTDHIICTNHYQSETFREDRHNIENIASSDSHYRFARLEELIGERRPLTAAATAAILRDRMGTAGADIGLANEKSINQSIAHHSVIFKPAALLMWVSTLPWQSGEYVCYDLGQIFSRPDFSGEICRAELSIPADTIFMKRDYPNILEYRFLLKYIKSGGEVSPDSLGRFVSSNENFYHTFEVVGDYYAKRRDTESALENWEKALTKEIPTAGQRQTIERKIKKVRK